MLEKALKEGDQAQVVRLVRANPQLIENVNLRAPIIECLTDPLLPSTLECIAYCKYKAKVEVPTFDIPRDFDFAYFARRKETNINASTAGYAIQGAKPPTTNNFINEDHHKPKSDVTISSQPWLIEFFICDCSDLLAEWWAFVIPALLNYLDTTDLSQRVEGVRLVKLLASQHAQKLMSTGLVPVFEEAIDPLLSFLPPMAEPEVSKKVHRPSVECLSVLAKIQPKSARNQRLNFIARNGTLKPFSIASEKVDLLIYFLNTLESFIADSLQSLTIVHFDPIVKLFNHIMADPFVKFNAELIRACSSMMYQAMRWSWPVVERYRFDIMFGLIKAKHTESACFEMLAPTASERETLSKINIPN